MRHFLLKFIYPHLFAIPYLSLKISLQMAHLLGALQSDVYCTETVNTTRDRTYHLLKPLLTSLHSTSKLSKQTDQRAKDTLVNVQSSLTECHPIHPRTIIKTTDPTPTKPHDPQSFIVEYIKLMLLTQEVSFSRSVTTALTRQNAGSLSREHDFAWKRRGSL